MNQNQNMRVPARSEPMTSSFLNSRGCALGLPISGNFELTARCNFNCRMCYVHRNGDIDALKAKELTASQWLSLASDARDRGMIFLLLTGGEPFLREDFAEIYTELIKMGIMVSINTNASLYNEELRGLFLHYPPSRINVTLYGGSEETYRSLCGNASYARVVDHLRSMRGDGFQVRLNVSLTPYNVQDMEKIHAVSNEIGLQAKASSYMYPPIRIGGCVGENVGRFSAQDAGIALAAWQHLRDTAESFHLRAERLRAGNAVRPPVTSPDGEGITCRAGRSSFWLTWDGKMMPCGTMNVDAAYPLRDGFRQAWEEVRRTAAAIRLPEKCSACAERGNCCVCAAICQTETGSFRHCPDYLCSMTESYIAEVLRLAQIDKGEL